MTVEGFYISMLEVKTDDVVGKEFGVHITRAKAKPRKQYTTRRDDEEPKFWGPHKVYANWNILFFCGCVRRKAHVHPEGDE